MKKNKGMTLIALVVTIIIMLILAGIAINAFIGDHGLFSRTKNATEKYKEVEGNEIISIDRLTHTAFNEKPKIEDDGTAINIGLETMTIKALATDVDEDKLTYTLSFGETESLGQMYTEEKEQGEQVSFDFSKLRRGKKYYWQIKVSDGKEEVVGKIHNGETNPNNAPQFLTNKTGTVSSTNGTSLTVTAEAIDIDGDEVEYILYWGTTAGNMTEVARNKTGSFARSGLGASKYSYRVDITDGIVENIEGTAKTATKCTGPFTRNCSSCGRNWKSC